MTTPERAAVRERGSWWIWIVIALLILLLICLFTNKGPRKSKKDGVAMALANGCPANAPPSSVTELNACLQNLEFDTTETVGDEQRLMVIGSGPGSGLPCAGNPNNNCRYGPLAKIEPVKGSQTYSDSMLNEGRIIARMFLRPGETETYVKFGLVASDTTYWWVSTAQEASVFVTTAQQKTEVTTVHRPLVRTPHDSGSFKQALARWVWDSTDERANGTCGSSCCKP